MTHVDDLYEPGDDREPAEPEQEPPLDLEAIEDSIRVYYAGSDDDSLKAAEDLLMVSSRLVAELREACQRIAEWEALETREEWTVTGGPDFPSVPGTPVFPGEQAVRYAHRHASAQAWRRRVPLVPWERIDSEPPF